MASLPNWLICSRGCQLTLRRVGNRPYALHTRDHTCAHTQMQRWPRDSRPDRAAPPRHLQPPLVNTHSADGSLLPWRPLYLLPEEVESLGGLFAGAEAVSTDFRSSDLTLMSHRQSLSCCGKAGFSSSFLRLFDFFSPQYLFKVAETEAKETALPPSAQAAGF